MTYVLCVVHGPLGVPLGVVGWPTWGWGGSHLVNGLEGRELLW